MFGFCDECRTATGDFASDTTTELEHSGFSKSDRPNINSALLLEKGGSACLVSVACSKEEFAITFS